MADFPSVIDLSTPGAAVIIKGDAIGDKAGWSVSEAGDVNGDGIGDFIMSALYAGGSGRAYVIFGKEGGLANMDLANALASGDGFAITGDAANDKLGFSVSGGGDYNGDGFDDLVIGAAYADSSTSDYGEVYVVFGKASGFGTVDVGGADAGNDFIRITGDNEGDKLGFSVSFAGDVNGDGRDDLVLGAPSSDSDTLNGGAAYVIFGQADGSETDRDLGAALAAGDGFVVGESSPNSYDQFGASVSGAGDLNGDGFDDFIVGAPSADSFAADRGAAYIFFGGATPATVPALKILGADGSDQLGKSVSGAGDVNGDGLADLIVGVYSGSDGGPSAGEAYVIFGKEGGWTNPIDVSTPLSAADGFQIRGSTDFDRFGTSVSSAGDVNGDGFDDIIVGAASHDNGDPDFNNRDSGAAYVIFGKASGFGTIDLDTPLDGSNGFKIQGDAPLDNAGSSVSSAGDVNGDGFDDILVGAKYGDDGGYSAGEVYVIFGRAPTTAVTRTGSAADQTIRGGAFNDVLSGLGGSDKLFGAAGADTLDGGSGADVLTGGIGNDTYKVDNVGDVIVEAAGEGSDSLASAFSYVLAAGVSVETLGTTNASSTTALNLTGNEINNSIFGNAGVNVLNGGAGNDSLNGLAGNDTLIGGDGTDTLRGGTGNDSYNVDSLDLIFENANEGSDQIVASASYTLAAGVSIEAIGTTNASSVAALNLTGNELNNSIYGNNGVNVLTGGAGNDSLNGLAGNDTLDGSIGSDVMAGGTGNDLYRVDSAGDQIVEAANAGNDTVQAAASFTLSAGSSIETLATLNSALTTALDLTGNELNNTIAGNAGINVLAGGFGSDNMNGLGGDDTLRGGAGNDVLRGGTGLDSFLFNTSLNAANNVDQVIDFSVADDTIVLENAVFTGLTAGELAPGAFRTGSAAADADDRIVYNSGTGALLFDVDGLGGAAGVQFATLSTGLALTASDFTVI